MTLSDAKRLFTYDHLPDHLQEVSKPFYDCAIALCENVRQQPMRTKALNDLWQAKNWAVAAVAQNP